MGFQISMVLPYREQMATPAVLVRPFYGVALSTAAQTPSFITSLSGRGPTAGSRNISIMALSSTGDNSYYYAYPVAYGQAQFMEVDSAGNTIGLGYGGWDGARGDPISLYGPTVITGVIADGQPAQDFYLYESDWPGLGTTYWQVS